MVFELPRLSSDLTIFSQQPPSDADNVPVILWGTEPFRSRANSLPGANRPIGLWPIRSLANLLPGPFVPWPFRSLELSLRGPFAPGVLLAPCHRPI